MADKIKKYLNVLQSATYSSEFKDLAAEQLLQFCDPRKSPQSTRNYLKLSSELLSEPKEGQFKRQHLNLVKGILRYYLESRPTILSSLLQAVLEDKEAGLVEYFTALAKDTGKNEENSGFSYQNLRLSTEVVHTVLSLADEKDIKVQEIIEKCIPLLGDKLQKEDRKEEVKKSRGRTPRKPKSTGKGRGKAKSLEKYPVSDYVSQNEASYPPIVLSKGSSLGLNTKKRKTESGTEEVMAGQILIEDYALTIYSMLTKRLLSENWYTRHTTAIILKELLSIIPYQSFAQYYVCDLEITPLDVPLVTIKTTKALAYDQKVIKAFNKDLAARLISGIVADHFTDYLENTIATPVRESFGNLLKMTLGLQKGPETPHIVEDASKIITKPAIEWMSRYNAMLLLKYFLKHWKQINTLPDYFKGIKEPLLIGLGSEDEIRVIACKLLKKCRALVCKDQDFYLEVVKAVFDNIKTADDIECSAIDMLILLETLFNENLALIKTAIQHIDLKLVFVFAYHKLEGIRHKAFSLLFRLIEQLFENLSRKMIEKSNYELIDDLFSLLQISIQAASIETNQKLLKDVGKGFASVVKLLDPEKLWKWYQGKRNFFQKLLKEKKVIDFSEFVFFQTEQYTATTSYYTFIGEPITNAEIHDSFNSKVYYLSKLYACLANHSQKISQDLLSVYLSPIPTNAPIEICDLSTLSFFFLYWLSTDSKAESHTLKTLGNHVLNKAEFVGRVSDYFDMDQLNDFIGTITNFSCALPEAKEISDAALADVNNDYTYNLDRYVFALKKLYQQQKELNIDSLKQECTAALLLECTKLQEEVECEGNNLRAIASSMLISISKQEKQLPDKLNPVIKPLAAVIKKSIAVYVLRVVGKALAELQWLNSKNPDMNEKIASLIFDAYLSASNAEIANGYIVRYVKRYVKLHGANAFKANKSSLQKYSMQTLTKAVNEKDFAAVLPRKVILELNLLTSLIGFVKSETHIEFLWILFDVLLQFATILGAEFDGNSLAETESLIKKLLTTLVKTIGKESYEPMTLSFIRIVSYRSFSGCRILSGFVTEMPKEYMAYLPYYILPIIRNFSSNSVELSELSYQLFSNILKILPINDASLFSNVPKLKSKSAESARIEAEGLEGVEFLKSFLTTEQKYNYEIDIPLNAKLREYQVAGISWMAFMHKYNINCALCDDMGLGKTVQALVLIANEIDKIGGCSKAPPSLVVCPTTLMKNWLYEIPKFFNEKHLKGKIYSGSSTGTPANGARGGKRGRLFENGSVIITSYERVRADIETLKKQEFFYIILDEAHVVRNSKAKVTQAVKQLKGQRKLILSGSPLHNNVTEIWSLFDFLNPGFLGSESSFEQTYTKHLMTNLKKINEKTKETTEFTGALEGLKQRIAPFILRRTKQDVLKDLPPKIMQDYNCKPSPMQKALLTELNQLHPLDCKPGAEEKELMLERIQWHLYLANHPKLLIKRSIDRTVKSPEQKPIITGGLLGQLRKEYGVKSWENIEMDHSGKMMSLRQLLVECGILTDSMVKGESLLGDENGTPTSSAMINELIEAQPNSHRALVFCQKISMLDILENDFLRQFPGLKYLRLDSRVDPGNRVDLARQFNEDPSIQLMLLTTKVGGYGLTLTGADTVIFYDHDWNPMNDLQAMDRTHRIGQTRTVNVYRLILLGTIEERVMNIQKFKQNLAKSLIENEKTTSDKLKLQDMFESFAEKADTSETKKKKSGTKLSYVDEIAMKWAETDQGKADDLE